MAYFLVFLLVYGAAIIVAFIIIKDIGNPMPVKNPYAKWLFVFFLSIWQVGCWRAGRDFNGAFGIWENIFIFVVVIWFIFQMFSYSPKIITNRKNQLNTKTRLPYLNPYPFSFEFKGTVVSHDNKVFVVNDIKFNSSDEAKKFINSKIT